MEALRDPAADTDKNETVSALEAFRYAEQKTTEFYETKKRLATEHPVLEDTGKGTVSAAMPRTARLRRRVSACCASGRTQRRRGSAKASSCWPRRSRSKQQIDKLKYQKAAMPPEEYKKQLTALLLELAKTQEELDK